VIRFNIIILLNSAESHLISILTNNTEMLCITRTVEQKISVLSYQHNGDDTPQIYSHQNSV